MIFKLLITCLAVVGLTLGTAISDSVVPKQQGYHYVQLALYHSKGYQCADKAYDQMSIVNETCLPLKAGSLKVLSHAKQLKYNSLRVWKSENCTNGWELQPLKDGECSDVSAYRSIRLVLKE